MPDIQQIKETDQVTFRVRGQFDPGTPLQVCDRILGAIGAADIRIDLSLAHAIQDSGLAIMAEVLCGLGAARVSIRGLSPHQRRLLRYLGLDVDEAGPSREGADHLVAA